ncbi:uncharacterized protein [Panulirus ornatus]|uniref:uncharacterized protein isoform X3 n=1 Tax=Panulirus ornatus TaxID=150431 RepID=UPI003A870A06
MAFPDVMITSNRILAGFPNGIGGVCCGRHTFMVWFLSMVFFPVTGISGPAGYPVNKERAKNPICQKTALIVCFSCAELALYFCVMYTTAPTKGIPGKICIVSSWHGMNSKLGDTIKLIYDYIICTGFPFVIDWKIVLITERSSST